MSQNLIPRRRGNHRSQRSKSSREAQEKILLQKLRRIMLDLADRYRDVIHVLLPGKKHRLTKPHGFACAGAFADGTPCCEAGVIDVSIGNAFDHRERAVEEILVEKHRIFVERSLVTAESATTLPCHGFAEFCFGNPRNAFAS